MLQILSVYDANVVCAIALPFTEGYRNLVKNIHPGLRRLNRHVLFVQDEEVWHLAPGVSGFFPTKPESVVEVFEK